MSANKNMTSQNAKKRAAPWSQADRRQSSSSVSPPPSPKRSEAWRKNLTLEECREGLVVYLPKEENIPKTSRIHHQPRGGNKWSHPHVITGVDEVTGFVQIRTITSHNEKTLLEKYSGTDRWNYENRCGHVLIEPKDDRNRTGRYNNPDSVTAAFHIAEGYADFRKVCYALIGVDHVFTIEPENIQTWDRHILLDKDSVRRLKEVPRIPAPTRTWGYRRISDPECERKPAKRMVMANPEPRCARSEEDLSWTTVTRSPPRTPSPPQHRWAQQANWRRNAGTVA